MGGFLKRWYQTTIGFPTKNDHFVVFWGYHHLRKHPYNLTNQGPFYHRSSGIFFSWKSHHFWRSHFDSYGFCNIATVTWQDRVWWCVWNIPEVTIAGWSFQTNFNFNFNTWGNDGKWSNLTNIFQVGWNHQLDWLIPGPQILKWFLKSDLNLFG